MENDLEVTPEVVEDPRIASLTRELGESRESEKYWSGLARSGGSGPRAEADPEPEEDGSEFVDNSNDPAPIENDSPEKLIDEFAAEGVKALAKRGFVTSKQAQQIAADTALRVTRELIGRERSKMDTDQKILGEFPELKDQNSELFKETAKRYQRAVAMDRNLTKTPAALFLAAEGARDSMRAKAQREDDDNESEGDRRQRAASQDARPRARGSVDDSDDMMGSEARTIARAMGITDAEFKAAKKETANRPVRRER